MLPVVAFFSDKLPGPNDLSNQARAFELSVHPLGDTPNRMFFGTPAMSVNQLSWRFLALKIIAESKNVPSAQIQQMAVANYRDPSCNVFPPPNFNSGRSAGNSLPLSSRGCRIISMTRRDCAWPITKPVSSVSYIFFASISCSATRTVSLKQ